MKRIVAISRDSMEDPLSLIFENISDDAQGVKPVFLMEDPDEELAYMSYESFTLEEARRSNG